MTNRTMNAIVEAIEARNERSAWARGVKEYALELVENLESLEDDDLESFAMVEKALLNGASNWSEYSWGGCSLIYNSDIAERLCTPSELKRTRNGQRRPNSNEEWLDTQARALFQASEVVKQTTARYPVFWVKRRWIA